MVLGQPSNSLRLPPELRPLSPEAAMRTRSGSGSLARTRSGGRGGGGVAGVEEVTRSATGPAATRTPSVRAVPTASGRIDAAEAHLRALESNDLSSPAYSRLLRALAKKEVTLFRAPPDACVLVTGLPTELQALREIHKEIADRLVGGKIEKPIDAHNVKDDSGDYTGVAYLTSLAQGWAPRAVERLNGAAEPPLPAPHLPAPFPDSPRVGSLVGSLLPVLVSLFHTRFSLFRRVPLSPDHELGSPFSFRVPAGWGEG